MSQQITLEEFDYMLKKCVEFYDGVNNERNGLIDHIYRERNMSDGFNLNIFAGALKTEYDYIIEYEKLKELLDKCKDFYGTSNRDLNAILRITSIPLLLEQAERIKSIYRDSLKKKLLHHPKSMDNLLFMILVQIEGVGRNLK